MAGFSFFAFFAFSQLLIAHSQWTHESFDKDKLKVSWKYDKPTDILLFKVDVQATGWVGFGFTLTPKDMKDYDVVVGGKASDKGYLHDLYSTTTVRPPLDKVQNYNLTKAEEANGKTTLWFQRARKTNDNLDLQFDANIPVYLVWAYHNTADALDPSSFQYHNSRGFSVKKYDLLYTNDSMTTTMPGSNATVIPTTQPSPTGDVSGKTKEPPTSGEAKTAASFIGITLLIAFMGLVVF